MSKDAIRSIQTGLTALGYAPGVIDGLDGPRTRAAALAFGQGKTVAIVNVQPETNAMIYQGTARYPVREIIVHCSATRPDWYEGLSLNAKRAEIRRWHLANGWSDIGYHWLIDRDGAILAGRAETVIGAHVVERNQGTIGICLIGGHGSAETDDPRQHFTDRQLIALRQQIQAISMRTQITTISGHNQYAAKACPGFDVPQWLKEAAYP
ncbi:peptidoglycan recognition protein family protein [Gemmobacter serpentinus]|uniref:peptidoglycan recognition protein family protein n=1 Tax=Gemmobacter serpentinus TaxID=2652247 RepID=UPI00124E13FA|nr:N-acetylmuramoyl-L-alanine amidase [Gemmobacter serpentinus]